VPQQQERPDSAENQKCDQGEEVGTVGVALLNCYFSAGAQGAFRRRTGVKSPSWF